MTKDKQPEKTKPYTTYSAHQKAYEQRPDVKARRKKLRSNAENKAKAKKYREDNKEHRAAYDKKYAAEHKKEKAIYDRKHENTPKRKAKKKEYRAKPEVKAKRKMYLKKYTQSPKVRTKRYINKRKRRALKAGVGHVDYKDIDIFKRDKWICYICGIKINKQLKWPDIMSKSIDHIIPISKGGVDAPHNVKATHLVCNLRKNNIIIK